MDRELKIAREIQRRLMPEEVKAALGGGIETALNLPLPITFTNGGDYIEVMSSQTSGGDLSVIAARVEIQQP